MARLIKFVKTCVNDGNDPWYSKYEDINDLCCDSSAVNIMKDMIADKMSDENMSLEKHVHSSCKSYINKIIKKTNKKDHIKIHFVLDDKILLHQELLDVTNLNSVNIFVNINTCARQNIREINNFVNEVVCKPHGGIITMSSFKYFKAYKKINNHLPNSVEIFRTSQLLSNNYPNSFKFVNIDNISDVLQYKKYPHKTTFFRLAFSFEDPICHATIFKTNISLILPKKNIKRIHHVLSDSLTKCNEKLINEQDGEIIHGKIDTMDIMDKYNRTIGVFVKNASE